MNRDPKTEQAAAAANEGAASPGESASPPGSLRAAQVVMTVGSLQFVLGLLFVARSKTIAVLLGPDGVGIVSVVDQMVQLVTQVSALALSVAPMKFISRMLHHGSDEVSKIYQALFKSLLVSLLLGTALSILLVALRAEVLGAELVVYRTIVLVGLLTVPTTALVVFFGNVLASAKSYRSSLFYSLAFNFGLLVAAYAGIRLGGINGLYYGNVVVGVAAVLGVLAYVRSTLQLEPHSRGFRFREELRKHPDLLAFCAVIYVLSFAQPLAFFLARYAVLKHQGSTEAGYFQAVFAIAATMSLLLTQSIRVYLEPIANRDLPVAEKIRHANDFLRSFGVLILFGALPLVLFPREILIVLFSSAFTAAAPFLFLLLLSDCIFLCAQVYLAIVLGVDDLKGFFTANLLAHVALAGLAWMLVPRYGLAGVAWAFLAARGVLLLLGAGRLVQKHGLRVPAGLAGLLAYIGVALVLGGLLGRGETGLSIQNVVWRLAIYGALGAGAYLFLNRVEKAWLRQLWTQIKTR